MGLRDRLKRAERAARGDLASFELLDGSRYYFSPADPDLFLHWFKCAGTSAHNWPPAPEVVRKLTEAKDVGAALESVRGEGSYNFIVYDPDVLISERRLEPRGLVSRYDPVLGRHVPQDPYEEGPGDQSEP